ncbi:MAG: succinate dehydrogenase assembly factor 2 [Pseudomonadota bacterium]
MSEPHAIRLKRLKIRSWRRGIKEMDMILGRFFDTNGESLAEEHLDAYERLLEENDQDLYAWVSGQADMPGEHVDIIQRIQNFS